MDVPYNTGNGKTERNHHLDQRDVRDVSALGHRVNMMFDLDPRNSCRIHDMTGKDLAKEMMSIRSDLTIVLCAGFSEKIDERIAEKMGISAFVMKPIVMS